MRNPELRRAGGYTLVELMVAVTITLAVMGGVYGLMVQNQHIYEQQTRIADVQQAARVALDLITRELRMTGGDPSQRAFKRDVDCEAGAYKWPTDPKVPGPDDIAPITVATASKIRIKMDRPTFILPAEPPPYTGNPHSDDNADGDYEEDDEHELGDGFINDEGEDITFEYDAATKKLFRIETRTIVPDSACRTSASTAAASAVTKTPIAEHVVAFELKYYDTFAPYDPLAPNSHCPPATAYADAAAYEAAKDSCDPPLSSITDMTAIQRVRVRLTVETDKPDSLLPKTAPKFGRQWITLASEAAVRNR